MYWITSDYITCGEKSCPLLLLKDWPMLSLRWTVPSRTTKGLCSTHVSWSSNGIMSGNYRTTKNFDSRFSRKAVRYLDLHRMLNIPP